MVLLKTLYMMNWLKVNKTYYDAKIKDIEDKIPSITGLADTEKITKS